MEAVESRSTRTGSRSGGGWTQLRRRGGPSASVDWGMLPTVGGWRVEVRERGRVRRWSFCGGGPEGFDLGVRVLTLVQVLGKEF